LKNNLHVLAIDDHAVVLQGYFSIFKHLETPYQINFKTASDCKSGHDIILRHRDTPFDVAVLDYSIPPYPQLGLHTGEDMAALVRRNMPGCKIIMMTMHREFEIFGLIIKKIPPDGFVNKSDCTTEELIEGFQTVIKGDTFYSNTIENYMMRLEKGIMLEEVDLRILYLLAKGIKNKNLIKYIPMSDSGIEKRKYRIKRLLEVDGDDEVLIEKARRMGYI
jgi:DNA-binding NarL/FixJ family response regulator